MEVWLLACILLVFGALAEYAFILRQIIKLSRQTRADATGPNSPSGGSPGIENGNGHGLGAGNGDQVRCSKPDLLLRTY